MVRFLNFKELTVSWLNVNVNDLRSDIMLLEQFRDC